MTANFDTFCKLKFCLLVSFICFDCTLKIGLSTSTTLSYDIVTNLKKKIHFISYQKSKYVTQFPRRDNFINKWDFQIMSIIPKSFKNNIEWMQNQHFMLNID